jgi:hypothetical protein
MYRTFTLALLLFAGSALGTTTAQADPPAAGADGVLGCYDWAKSYSKPAGTQFHPRPADTHLTATTFCQDIQIRPTASRYVKVCFKPSTGAEYCQVGYKYAAANVWTVIATSVQDKTKFYFKFQSPAASNGKWAA